MDGAGLPGRGLGSQSLTRGAANPARPQSSAGSSLHPAERFLNRVYNVGRACLGPDLVGGSFLNFGRFRLGVEELVAQMRPDLGPREARAVTSDFFDTIPPGLRPSADIPIEIRRRMSISAVRRAVQASSADDAQAVLMREGGVTRSEAARIMGPVLAEDQPMTRHEVDVPNVVPSRVVITELSEASQSSAPVNATTRNKPAIGQAAAQQKFEHSNTKIQSSTATSGLVAAGSRPAVHNAPESSSPVSPLDDHASRPSSRAEFSSKASNSASPFSGRGELRRGSLARSDDKASSSPPLDELHAAVSGSSLPNAARGAEPPVATSLPTMRSEHVDQSNNSSPLGSGRLTPQEAASRSREPIIAPEPQVPLPGRVGGLEPVAATGPSPAVPSRPEAGVDAPKRVVSTLHAGENLDDSSVRADILNVQAEHLEPAEINGIGAAVAAEGPQIGAGNQIRPQVERQLDLVNVDATGADVGSSRNTKAPYSKNAKRAFIGAAVTGTLIFGGAIAYHEFGGGSNTAS